MTARRDFDHEASVDAVRTYFDQLGAGEWDRLVSDLPGRVSLEMHQRFLRRFLTSGMRVLEVGAGPGRFTILLASLGAQVVVTDLSPVQLELNARLVAEAGWESAVESRTLLDVCDVSRFHDGEFDAVLAYGGPLSYAFDEASSALGGLLRVTRSGGPVVASVMSTLGAYRYFLPSVLELSELYGDDVNDRIIETGDLRETQPPGSGQHTCRMFRSRDIEALVAENGATLRGLSASNWASLGDPDALLRLSSDPFRWDHFLDREVALCAEPGAVDGGTHLLFAASR
ncbi:MAG: class I SAM-dependent methyltransferase [Nocardioidaceae bacterium]